MSEKSSSLPPKRGDVVIYEVQDGLPYVCLGWIDSFIVLMSIEKPKPEDVCEFWFEVWETTEEKDFTIISLPDPVREAWAKILPKTITLLPETDLK
jgi:hypothetical protein